MKWLFKAVEKSEALEFFNQAGFVGFNDLISSETLSKLKSAADNINKQSSDLEKNKNFISVNDIVCLDSVFLDFCRQKEIVQFLKRIIKRPIELQHAKLNIKQKVTTFDDGEVAWHQDFPFYPHTNFDLVSCVIHLDDEKEHSSPMCFIPGSHNWGVLSHVGEDGTFAYKCVDSRLNKENVIINTACKAGTVTFHHALTLHCSEPPKEASMRRLAVFQYRAIDAVQIAGVVRKCNGTQVEKLENQPKVARFPDGTVIEMRGCDGRLIDLHGTYAPD